MRRTPDSVSLPTHRDLIGLALPALGTLAAEPLMGLLDTALIGHVGSVELAALGAATAILNLLFSILVFLEYGTTAQLARRFGAGQTQRLSHEAVQMSWLALGLGVAMTLVLVLVPRKLLWLVDAPPGVVGPAAMYLSIRAAGSIPGLWIRVANGIFRGLQDTRTPLWIVVGINVLNAILDVILIFGWSSIGVPAFGIAGAAWATVAATTTGALVFAWVLRRRLRAVVESADPSRVPETAPRASLSRGRWTDSLPHWATLRRLLTISRDLVLRTIPLMAALFMGSRMAAGLGTSALAAHQVGWQLWGFMALVLDSLAIAGQALVGRWLGAGRPDVARVVGNRLCRWSLVLGALFAGLFLALQHQLPRVFSEDPAVLARVGSIFLVLALMQVPNAVLFAIDGLLIGASDFAFLRTAMITLGILGVGTTWLGREIGDSLLGVWLGIATFMIARLVVMGQRWRGGKWSDVGWRDD